MLAKTTAIVFEGGVVEGAVTEAMQPVRRAACLDMLEILTGLPGYYDKVILATNFVDLEEEAKNLGVVVLRTTSDATFDFGVEIKKIVAEVTTKSVLYLSGAGSPLLSREEFIGIAEDLAVAEALVITNNPQSSDVVGWTPAMAIMQLETITADNALGYLLRRDADLPRQLMEHSVGVHFDIDTPTDIMMLKLVDLGGRRLKQTLAEIDWDLSPYLALKQVLTERISERQGLVPRIWMSGRIGAPVITHINTHLIARLRIVSEERGMKSMGQEGMVCSFVGSFLDDLGTASFYRYLHRSSDAALIDTRPIFAHFRIQPSDNDRFASDLLLWREVEDPWVREFTKAASESTIPIILGGHTLILGGIWALVDAIRAERAERNA